MKVNYPYGQPMMHDYTRRPVEHKRAFNPYRHRNKYHARKVVYQGHRFDSKAELTYYLVLKREHVQFRLHPRYEIVPHYEYQHRGHTYKVRKHSYTPDFVLYKHGEPYEVDDIKGTALVPSYDHLRFDLFSIRYHVPVTIIRIKNGRIHKKVWDA